MGFFDRLSGKKQNKNSTTNDVKTTKMSKNELHRYFVNNTFYSYLTPSEINKIENAINSGGFTCKEDIDKVMGVGMARHMQEMSKKM